MLLRLQLENREDEQAAKLTEIRTKGDEDRKTLQVKLGMESEMSMIDADKDRIPDQLEMEMANQTEKMHDKDIKFKEKELKVKEKIEMKKIAASKSHKTPAKK